jgi:hypothetical protein
MTQELFRDDSELTELSEEELRQLDEAWDDPDGVSEAGYVAETDDLEDDRPGAPEEETSGERTDTEKTGREQPAAIDTAEAAESQAFTLKHLDEVRTVGRDEVVKLAQQGMDYERVRSERDQLRKYREEIGPALRRSGLRREKRHDPRAVLEFCSRRH